MFEIGNSLREARLRQQLDFPQVEQATKIRGKYLRALEEEQFEVLPSQTYVKGFLRTYAEFLGLDGQLYVDEYNSRYVVDQEDMFRPRRSYPRARQQRRLESRVVLLALLGIAALTALVIVAWKFGGGNGAALLPTVTGSTVTTAQPLPPIRPTGAHLVVKAVGGSSYVEVRLGSAHGKADAFALHEAHRWPAPGVHGEAALDPGELAGGAARDPEQPYAQAAARRPARRARDAERHPAYL